MADFNKRVFDYITLFDDANVNITYRNNISDNMSFSDNARIFDIFKVNNTDEIRFKIHSIGIISDYIKRISNDYIKFGNNSKALVFFKDKTGDNVKLLDSSLSYTTTHKDVFDQTIIRTKAYGNVIYGPDNTNDEANFSDSVFAIISKHSSRRFKNAMFNLLGTTEETIYICTSKNTTIMNISMCNRTLNNVNVDVLLYKSGTPTYIMKGILVKPHQAYVINNNDETNVQLEENDEIRIITDTDNSSDIYIALMEQI